MNSYSTDDEQVEAIKKWWKENGKAIIAGGVIGIGGVFGWQWWTSHQETTAQQASDLFEQLNLASRTEQTQSAEALANQLIQQYGDSTYAVFAAMLQARLALEAKDFVQAENRLRFALEQTDHVGIRHIARLRLTRLLLARNNLDDAKTLLESVTERDSFSGAYAALEGDLALRLGDTDLARERYQTALDSQTPDPELIEMKLHALPQS